MAFSPGSFDRRHSQQSYTSFCTYATSIHIREYRYLCPFITRRRARHSPYFGPIHCINITDFGHHIVNSWTHTPWNRTTLHLKKRNTASDTEICAADVMYYRSRLWTRICADTITYTTHVPARLEISSASFPGRPSCVPEQAYVTPQSDAETTACIANATVAASD